jgi:hypothetical protein
VEKKFSETPGVKNKVSFYKGKWVEQILFNPPTKSRSEYAPKKSKGLQKESSISLPKGVEFSIGLLNKKDSKDETPELISSPPVLLLLHSGMEFKLPLPETKGNNAPS